jgi:hypothetical protein
MDVGNSTARGCPASRFNQPAARETESFGFSRIRKKRTGEKK